MLIENDKHRKYHASGPKDVKWGERNEKGELKAVATIGVMRQTIDNEQLSISVPVFADDSREDLELRLGMFMSIAQDRIEDANQAWAEAANGADEEERLKQLEKKKKAAGKE